MSHLGLRQTFDHVRAMSPIPPKVDIRPRRQSIPSRSVGSSSGARELFTALIPPTGGLIAVTEGTSGAVPPLLGASTQ